MSGEKVLVVDDEPQVRKLLESFLSRNGYTVGLAADGLQALELVRQALPDLVITDVSMPNMTGLELTRRLRGSHKTAAIPILMLSALKQEPDVLAGYGEGADDYVLKPIEMAILKAKIDTLLRRLPTGRAQTGAESGAVVLFMHGKGGVGATTLAVNAAVAMASRGPERIGLLDLNLVFGNSDLLLDVREPLTLSELANSWAEADSDGFAHFLSPHDSGVQLVVANRLPEHAEMVSSTLVKLAFDQLRQRCDYVFIDLPADFSEHTLAAIEQAQLICLVTTARLSSLKATRDCIEVLQKLAFPAERMLLVLNQTLAQPTLLGRVGGFFKRQPDAVVEPSELFDQASDVGRPLITEHPQSRAAEEVRSLAKRIADAIYAAPKS